MKLEKRNTGFTLIELLVVIAIIAMLLSIMVPSLKKAKDQAKKVVCQAHLSQQKLGWAMYIDSNDKRYPYVHEERAGGKAGTWPDCERGNRRLTPYAGDAGVFECPADRGYGDITNCFDQLGTSFVYNTRGDLNAYGWGLALKKNPTIRKPSRVILAGDNGLLAYWSGLPALYPQSVKNPPFWHNRRKAMMNTLFVDLHIDTVYIVPTPDAWMMGGATDPDGKWTFSAGWNGPHPASSFGVSSSPYW